jgi:hypothetical protein
MISKGFNRSVSVPVRVSAGKVQRRAVKPAAGSRLFHRTGLIYFWCLNDACEPQRIASQIDAFADAKVAAVCLHPRAGLLLPYGGDEWFAFIRETACQCRRKGVDVWLYDEDPYPSGSAGGRIIAEHPEYAAHAIEMFTPKPAEKNACLTFPAGKLLWCGILDPAGEPVEDLTSRVGMVRQNWSLRDPWDSRFYYPGTPLYSCPRSFATGPEFAVRCRELQAGERLVAFVARPCERESIWNGLHDSLNPQVTKLFLEMTHERYAAEMGDLFGREITAMFTDEPKYFGVRPWTPGVFEDFEHQFGYDLRPRLADLFATGDGECEMLSRLHYRQWCGQRFEQAWLKPVAEWCRRHNLPLVGHISPEDDPVQQSVTVSNLFPLYKHFAVPGLDLIIPAVGDRNHPLINIGVTAAVSAAQQNDRPGVMSESLAASGLDMQPEQIRKILLWQATMGVTTPVIHGAFNSTEGLREFDAPPDYGPSSPRWGAMQAIARDLQPIQQVVRDANRQVAPVAILWPIRSFQARGETWQADHAGLRAELVELLASCLDRQVGVHLIDEADLCEASIEVGQLRMGRATYRHVLVPGTLVLHEQTVAMLQRCEAAEMAVSWTGTPPKWVQGDRGLQPAASTDTMPTDVVARLPRLLELTGDTRDIRCTGWQHDGRTAYLLMNLAAEPACLQLEGEAIELPPGQVRIIWRDGEALA